MNEQSILLVLIVLAAAITIFTYIWKAKKQMNYRNDERWQLVQLKSANIANYSLYIPIVVLCITQLYTMFRDAPEMTFTFTRVAYWYMLYFGLRNLIELVSLLYYDTHM